jgi:hypothetical protein
MFKNRAVKTATLLHFSIWFVAEFGVDGELVQLVLDSLADPDEVFLPGSYPAGPKTVFFSAVHLAAGLGQLDILKILANHACNATSEEKMMSPEQYITQWAKITQNQTLTGQDYMDISKEDGFTKFYQPIHDSSFQGYGEVTLWLLRQKAECTRNKDRITPLHFLAFSGIVGAHDRRLGEDLKAIVKALTETGRRGEGVASTADMSNFIPGARCVTPLEVAVEDASRFPQDYLGLLAPCLAEGHHLSYFDDIKRIADVTSDGALNLVRTIAKQGKKHQHILRRFRINAQRPGTTDILASIFYSAPLAASEMLELLEMEPDVEDPAHHAVPARTSMWGLLKNVPMRCTYQTESINKDNLLVPFWEWKTKKTRSTVDAGWHRDFVPRPSRTARGSHIKSVRVVTCLIPNILDIDVFMAFAHCEKDHLATMSKKTVQGAIYCLWGNLVEYIWCCDVIYRFADVVAYVALGVIIQAETARMTLAWTIVAGGSLHQLIMIIFTIGNVYSKYQRASDPTMVAMWSPFTTWALSYFIPTIGGTLLALAWSVDLAFKTTDRDQFDDRLLALCLLVACCRFIWTWRMSNIGATIYTISETCFASAVNQMLFITCMLLFSTVMALMILSRFHTVGLAVSTYRAFMFGDDYGFHDLGMDIGHDSVFAGTDGVLLISSVIGAFFFNVIVLNIIIAIYGHEYEKNQIHTPELFMVGRADYCVKTILSSYIISWRGKVCNRIFIGVSLATIAVSIVLGVLQMYMWTSALLFAFGETLLRVALVQCDWFSPEGQDSDGDPRFLWVCHARDWQIHMDDDATMDDHIEALSERMDDDLGEVKSQLRDLDEKISDICDALQFQRTPKTTKSKGT